VQFTILSVPQRMALRGLGTHWESYTKSVTKMCRLILSEPQTATGELTSSDTSQESPSRSTSLEVCGTLLRTREDLASV
jgi:hypothetical protein